MYQMATSLSFISWTALLSLIVLTVHAFGHFLFFKLYRNKRYRQEKTASGKCPPVVLKSHIAFSASRCLGCLMLLVLQIIEFTRWNRYLGLLFVYIYTFILSLASFLFLLRSKTNPIYLHWISILQIHLTVTVLISLGVYTARDIYPLLISSNGRPLDLATPVWSRISLLFLVAIVVPLVTPRIWVPLSVDPILTSSDDSLAEPNPEQVASPLSLLFLSFISNVIWKAYRVDHLSAKELPPLADSDHVWALKKRWFTFLERYSSARGVGVENEDGVKGKKKKPKRALIWTLAWMFRWMWLEMFVAAVGVMIGNLGSPIAVNRLLSYLESSSSSEIIHPSLWILLLFLSPITLSLSTEWYSRIGLRLNTQIDAMLTQLIYEHSLRIRIWESVSNNPDTTKSGDKPGGKGSKTKKGAKSQTGMINNLVTTDLSNVSDLRNWIMVLVGRPIEFVVSVVFLYRVLGWSAFVGIFLMIALAPIPMKMINAGRKLFLERMRRTDIRVAIFTDVVSILRMIKVFGWESKMLARITAAREDELKVLKKRLLFLMAGNLSQMLCYLTVIMKQDLTPSRVFSSLLVFGRLQTIVTLFIANLGHYYTAVISLGRIQQFLSETELIDEYDPTAVAPAVPGRVIALGSITEDATEGAGAQEEPDSGSLIGYNNATFSWTKNDAEAFYTNAGEGILPVLSDSVPPKNSISLAGAPTSMEDVQHAPSFSQLPPPHVPRARKFFLTISDKVLFPRNRISLITGPTGSGKTAMLLALLGEMYFIPAPSLAISPGAVSDSWYHIPRGISGKGVAYAAQESWVLNETIRSNILFHTPFDEVRYRKVLYQCGLEQDLEFFSSGDMTEVGERGLTLSGGQKARLTLARGVYSEAEILLLDDVLAALDVHTSKWIVEKCFLGDLMKERTVILVTHNTALTLPLASFVVTMKDGRVANQESTRATWSSSLFLAETRELLEDDLDEVSAPKHGDKVIEADTKTNGKLIVDEEVQMGHVSWSAIKLYAVGMGGRFPVIFFMSWIGGLVITHLMAVFQTWYLGFWASQYEIHDPNDVPVALYLGRYAVVVILTMLVSCFTATNYIFGTNRASHYIHQRMVESILGTTIRWLDKTPVSRMITRSSQDINAVDITIYAAIREFTEVCIRLLSRLGAVVLFSPIFIIPGFIIFVIGTYFGSVYFRAQMSVKREMSIAKAPMIGYFGATIIGLTSIRAYGAQDISTIEMQKRTDYHSRIARVFNNLQRWMAVRIQMLSAIFTTSLAWYLVFVLRQSASVTGFSLNMAVSFSGAIFSFILHLNALEARSNSIERIDNYLHIEQEEKADPSRNPPAAWPTSGDLRVEGLSAKYSPDGPEVLHELSFHIKSGERIGVVGRTGSGKSSLTLSLLRCIYTSGNVYYDGLPINKINLEALRSKITIIPQMPELISGSIRENLDPFEEHDDLTLNDALESAGLQALQQDLLEKDQITLDTMVSSGGSNFSLGQRQIIALARAIVRRNKLLILDEATSAIDYKTDSIIQSSLRTQLIGDVTMITIAHRLQTIMDADRIMVLHSGNIVEFDEPIALLQNPDGYLRALVDQSFDKDALIEAAESKLTSVD